MRTENSALDLRNAAERLRQSGPLLVNPAPEGRLVGRIVSKHARQSGSWTARIISLAFRGDGVDNGGGRLLDRQAQRTSSDMQNLMNSRRFRAASIARWSVSACAMSFSTSASKVGGRGDASRSCASYKAEAVSTDVKPVCVRACDEPLPYLRRVAF